jgi:small subunit ribosomal protein S20
MAAGVPLVSSGQSSLPAATERRRSNDGGTGWGETRPLLALRSRFAVAANTLDVGRSQSSHTIAEDTVANIKSQKKRILTNAKAAERNKAVKSELKTRVKSAVNASGDDSSEALRMAVKRLDMAASKGVIHKNQAARRKSRLMKKLNAG